MVSGFPIDTSLYARTCAAVLRCSSESGSGHHFGAHCLTCSARNISGSASVPGVFV